MKEKVYLFFKDNPTVFITMITAYGYYCAYFYEKGYCNYFRIPTLYINIGIIDVIKFTASIIGVFYVMAFHLRGVVFDRLKIDGRNARKRVFFETNFIAVMIAYFLSMTIELPDAVYYSLWSVVVALNVIIYIYFRSGAKKALRLTGELVRQNPNATADEITEKVLESFHKPRSGRARRPTTFIEQMLNYAALVVVVLPFGCFFLGFGAASKETRFSFLSDRPTMAIIRIYGEEIICKNYEPKKGKLGDSLLVFKLDNSAKISSTIKTVKNP